MFFFSQDTGTGKNSEIINKKSVTLQVRIPKWNRLTCGKRAFSTASLWKKGSLTVEAAFVFPLFLFAMVTLMTPFSMMNRQRQVQAVVESVCEDLCRLAYVGYELKEKKTEIKLPEEEGLDFGEHGLDEAAMMAYAQIQIRQKLDMTKIQKLSLLKSEFLNEDEMVILTANYELKLPFSVFGMLGIPMTSRSSRRAWTGRDGGWLEEGKEDGNEEDEIVYVGKNSTRYHQSRTCHYLYNKLTSVSREEIEDQRNASGGKYYPCAVCKGGTGGQVYIMASGTSYHGSSSCTSIIAYVRAVKKSEVVHLGACSYCSGG